MKCSRCDGGIDGEAVYVGGVAMHASIDDCRLALNGSPRRLPFSLRNVAGSLALEPDTYPLQAESGGKTRELEVHERATPKGLRNHLAHGSLRPLTTGEHSTAPEAPVNETPESLRAPRAPVFGAVPEPCPSCGGQINPETGECRCS